VAVFVAVGVAGLLVWPRDLGWDGLLRSTVVYLLLFGAVLLAPVVLDALGRLAGLPFRFLFRPEERLARAAIARDRGRTTLTVGALAIGLAMVVAVGAVAHQSRLAAAAWLRDVIPGDELLTSIRPVALDEDVLADVAAVDGVARVSPIATFDVARDGVRYDAAAVRGADLAADGRLTFLLGDRAEALAGLDRGGVAILPRAVADRTALTVGSTLSLALGAGKVADLRVAGIVDRSLPGSTGEAILVGWPDATSVFGVEGADALAVRYEPGAEATARPVVEGLARESALEPSPLETVAGAIDSALGQVFGLFDALAVIAVVVAALGIVNTLTVGVLERVREIGVLRASGMTRTQVRRTVVVEAGILGIVGALLGIATGLIAAALLVVWAGAGRLILEVPWPSILIAVVLGVGVSMLAAWYPARLASRLAIVSAVRRE
jgi:putative ABC transport system permease protein